MDNKNLAQDFEDQFNDVVSRIQSKKLFQSDWDIVSFAIFFIFIGECIDGHCSPPNNNTWRWPPSM